jgi:hypothetical protein
MICQKQRLYILPATEAMYGKITYHVFSSKCDILPESYEII